MHRVLKLRCLRLGVALLVITPILGSHEAAIAQQSHPATAFLPAGQGILVPQRVSTATVPQARVGAPKVASPNTSDVPPAQTSTVSKSVIQVSSIPVPQSTYSPVHSGMSDSGYVPDPNGAGGASNYMEATNKGIVIYSRSGAWQYGTTFNKWFGSMASSSANFYDPNVLYDQLGRTFIFDVIGGGLMFSVAQQTSATSSNFCNYSIPQVTGWGFDFDKIGMNAEYIYFSANLVAGPGQENNAVFRVSRAAVESCGTASYTEWLKLTNPDGTVAQAIVPVVEQDTSSNGNEYLVNSVPAGACQLTVWTVPNTSTVLARAVVPTQCYSPPPHAPQRGSSGTIGPGDCSVSHASYINGLMTLDVTGSYNWGDGLGSVGVVEWFVLNPSSNSVASQGSFGVPGVWLLYPAVIGDYNGNLTFVYGASNSTMYPSLWMVRDVNGVYTGGQILAQGMAPYSVVGTSPFADYQAAWLDDKSTNPNGVWVTGAFAARGGNTWGTSFALLPPAS